MGAALPSILALRNTIKVDLSPTRVDSSVKTFILLLLYIILVKIFFFICKDICLIISTATVLLCKTGPMSIVKVCKRFATFCHIISCPEHSRCGMKRGLLTLCI